jgi:CubicO group peptidase (beta-lactamase class C family)
MSLSVRAVELLAGRNYWEAMEEELLGPLGIRDMWPGGTGFSAEDLARLGVLVANGGRYGDLEFFSGETCRAMMPVQLRTHFTKLDKAISRGIGFVVISPGYYGHGGGCGTLLMVEPEKHIVFAMTRMEADDDLKVFKRKAYALLQTYRKAAPPCRP